MRHSFLNDYGGLQDLRPHDRRAMLELFKAARHLRVMSERRLFTLPAVPCEYREPLPKTYYGCDCLTCGRKVSFWGSMCRYCYRQRAWNRFFISVYREETRIDAFNRVFYNVTQQMEIGMAKNKQLPVTSISRSTVGLREALFDEMDALRNGTSNAQRARSMAMMANSILQSVQVEIEYHKYVNANAGRDAQKKVVGLGTSIALVEQKAV